MLRVRDIMTTDVITVTPETTLREAMELFASHHVSGAPVVSGKRIVGVVSTTDLMMFAASLAAVPSMRDRDDDWQGAGPSSADGSEDATNDSPSYFADLWEDAGVEVTSRLDAPSSSEWNALDEHDVSEAMTRMPVVTLGADASADAAADLMRRRQIHRILITDGDLLVGIVSALDVVAAVADHRFSVRRYVLERGRTAH